MLYIYNNLCFLGTRWPSRYSRTSCIAWSRGLDFPLFPFTQFKQYLFIQKLFVWLCEIFVSGSILPTFWSTGTSGRVRSSGTTRSTRSPGRDGTREFRVFFVVVDVIFFRLDLIKIPEGLSYMFKIYTILYQWVFLKVVGNHFLRLNNVRRSYIPYLYNYQYLLVCDPWEIFLYCLHLTVKVLRMFWSWFTSLV